MKPTRSLLSVSFAAIIAYGWHAMSTEITETIKLQAEISKMVGQMTSDLSNAHMLLEESLAGAVGVDELAIQDHLSMLESNAGSLIDSLPRHVGELLPMAEVMRDELHRFGELARQQLRHAKGSMPASAGEQQFDELFLSIIEQQQGLKERLDELTGSNLQRFQLIQSFIAFLFIIFITAVLTMIGRYNRSLKQAMHDSQLAEQRARASQESLARAQQIAQIGNWDWDIEADSLLWSDEIYRIFGLEPQQFKPTYKAFLKVVHPEDRLKLEDAVNMAVTSNRPYNINHRIVLPNGRVRYVHEQGRVEYGHSGDPKRMIGTVQDITERYLVEQELEKLFSAIKQAGEIIVITDHEGVIEYVNPAFTAITGYTPGEAIGKKPSILKSDLQDPAYYREMWQTISRGDVWKGSMIDRKKDGSYLPVMMTVSPVKDDRGVITHYISVQQDMSEHQQLEEQLRQSQKMEALGTLVGGIAHDFNNMLAGMLGNTYLVRLRHRQGKPFDDLLDAIDSYGNRAAEMIKQMLTFARNDNIELTPVNLSNLFKESSKLIRTAIPGNISCHFSSGRDELKVLGDISQIQNVLLNLANNAKDAVEQVEDPVIELELSRFVASQEFFIAHPQVVAREYARITVRDNGSGISQEHIKRIFDPFFTTKGVNKGTGLGLSMVYGAVQRHGGVIEVESMQGQFTLFNIYLPLVEGVVESLPASSGVSLVGEGQTILLADDEESLLAIHSDLLIEMGFKVLRANSGQGAIELFEANRESIELAILDVVMPKIGGVEAARRIQELSPGFPVIFITGYDLNEALRSGEQLRNHYALQKPFTVGQLAEKIRLALNKPLQLEG